jgi:hypothetical protein
VEQGGGFRRGFPSGLRPFRLLHSVISDPLIGITLDSLTVRVLKVAIHRRFVACTHTLLSLGQVIRVLAGAIRDERLTLQHDQPGHLR